MPEYINVEKPFLEKLKLLGWEVIDLGFGIPSNPNTSLRENFRQVVLPDVFRKSIKRINAGADGKEWLTNKQVDEILFELQNFPGKGLHEVNKELFQVLTKGITVLENELTGEKNPIVRLIDFKRAESNSFNAINQFRIDTPGSTKKMIIPDIVLFVNGLPLVVVEAKDFDVAEPLSEACEQIRSYSNTREDLYGVQEGEERLFHFNLFSIITHGEEARVGTISSDFEFYNNWVDIFPEVYRTIQVSPNEQRQEVLIEGMLNKSILLDLMKHFTLFMEVKKGVEIKIIARYNQFRAVGKIIENLLNGQTPMQRSGVIWHTQGSGKSLTMVFLIKKIRSNESLRDLKILFVVDRVDLEEQLSETASLTNEPVRIISKRSKLNRLKDDTNDVNMVMIHKFLAEGNVSAQSLIAAGLIPQFKKLDSINESERILILIDEAHRTQGGDMGDNLFSAFPNAMRIGFTGTPLLTDRHEIKTHDRFGGFIDYYKFDRAVKDRATVEIKYIGKVSKDFIEDKEQFDSEFEDMFRQRSEEERLEIQKRYGSFIAYLESKERIREIAKDIIDHYYEDVLVNRFKAQVVASSIVAAVRYKYELELAIKAKIELLKSLPDDQQEEERIAQLEFLKVASIVSGVQNEQAYIRKARREAIESNAIENFKADFKFDKPETGIGILCVCDRLLTGFDAPIEQVMYLDKSLREHDLFQAITRVNRTRKGKSFGLIVDYFGVTKHLQDALSIFTDRDKSKLSEFLDTFRDINKEIPVMEARYKRVVDLFVDYDLKDIKNFLDQAFIDPNLEFEFAEDCIEKAKNIRFRAELLTYARAFFDSLDLLFNTRVGGEYWIRAKRLGYLLWRIKDRYKDPTMDLKWASEKVRRLIDKHLQSEGIDQKVSEVSILSPDFTKKVDSMNRTPKSKASEMEHAIRHHIKVNLDKDPGLYNRFKDRLEAILKNYKENWDSILGELQLLRDEMAEGRKPVFPGISIEDAPFFDLMITQEISLSSELVDKSIDLLTSIMPKIKMTAEIKNFWTDKSSERKKIEGEIEDAISFARIPTISERAGVLTGELMKLAEKRQAELK